MVRLRQQLLPISAPLVAGIVNVTPDSFAVHCATMSEQDVLATCEDLLQQGADWLDVGACSTRPGSVAVSEQEEIARLDMALAAIRRVYPKVVISVDTYRSRVAERVITQWGVDIINDVSGMEDEAMVDVVARAHVPYVLTCPGRQMLSFFSEALDRLHQAGVADVILDPGLGFGKTLEQNYQCLHELNVLKQLDCPILIGLSRKSMIYQTLGCTPMQALNGTTAAHMLALQNGAAILRVHDVKEAKESIKIWKTYSN